MFYKNKTFLQITWTILALLCTMIGLVGFFTAGTFDQTIGAGFFALAGLTSFVFMYILEKRKNG